MRGERTSVYCGFYSEGSPALLALPHFWWKGISPRAVIPLEANAVLGSPASCCQFAIGAARKIERRGTPRRCCTPLALNSTKSAGEPLSGRKSISEQGAARDRVLPCVRPLVRHGWWPRARMGVRGSGPHHWSALEALPVRLVLLTPPHRRCAIPVLRPPYTLDGLAPAPAYAAAAGARYVPPFVSSAQAMRAFLLASATITSIGGLRASMRASQEPAATPLRLAQRTTPEAAMISSRRSVRSPMREVRPSRSLPPVECCSRVRPTQAAKSRPERKVSTGGASASIAVAIRGPMPGMFMSRRAPSSRLARAAISASSAAILLCSPRSVSTRTARHDRAGSGMPELGSSICAINWSTCDGPWGAIRPYSAR